MPVFERVCSFGFINSTQDVLSIQSATCFKEELDLSKSLSNPPICSIQFKVSRTSSTQSIEGVLNLGEILPLVDQILIDRGDLSREVSIEKIPFIQRTIIARSKSMDTPVYVATNLLESMIKSSAPTRAEVNDVASTLLMGASGLVLAAETAIGDHPVGAVKMINSIIKQYNRWTPNSSCKDIIFEKL